MAVRDVLQAAREFGDRPMPESRAWMIVTAGIILVVAVSAVLILSASPAPREVARPAPLPAAPAEPAAPPREEAPPPPAPEVSSGSVRAAKHAARVFLRHYLPYTYGRGDAKSIQAASPALLAQLAARPPHAPAAERHRHARVIVVTVEQGTPRTMRAVAVAEDGERTYSIGLQLELTPPAGWQVTGL